MSVPNLNQPIRPLAVPQPPPAPTVDPNVPKWPYSVTVDGQDLFVSGYLTTFGDDGTGTILDPQDSGNTASGLNTKYEVLYGVAIAIDSRLFAGMQQRDPAGYKALLNAPWPKVPFKVPGVVKITINGRSIIALNGVIDLGPGIGASKPGQPPHVGDLSLPLAKLFVPTWSSLKIADDFEFIGELRYIGGAQYKA